MPLPPGPREWGSASPARLALSEPSRWMVTSALSISSRLWPDKMLPSRSGTGASSTSGSGAVAGTLLLQADQALPSLPHGPHGPQGRAAC